MRTGGQRPPWREGALASIREAVHLDPERHLSLLCFALHNLASLLVDIGRYNEAAQVSRSASNSALGAAKFYDPQ